MTTTSALRNEITKVADIIKSEKLMVQNQWFDLAEMQRKIKNESMRRYNFRNYEMLLAYDIAEDYTSSDFHQTMNSCLLTERDMLDGDEFQKVLNIQTRGILRNKFPDIMVPIQRLQIVRERDFIKKGSEFINNQNQALYLVEEIFRDLSHEEVFTINLDASNRAISVTQISCGSTTNSALPNEEIIKNALAANSNGIILIHNHPDGTLYPSELDQRATYELYKACLLMNIRLVDHIIVAPNGHSISLRNAHFFEKYDLPDFSEDLEIEELEM